jgi:NAD(P)-dependent dehydrogenase (short-subunit alcohol dehydrogenase family)
VGQFDGKTALVTGGGAGIGRATARAFAREGARVVIGNRNADRGNETVDLILKAGGTAVFRRTDVTAAADVAALVDLAVNEFGALDFAFNNAGVFAGLSPITEQSEADYDVVMDTNVKGVWLSLKYELRQMLKQGHGVIVNNASVGGIIGSGGGLAPYTASKHAVVGLTKCAALENARSGVRVNAVCPAVVDTDMADKFAKELGLTMAQFGDVHPIGRIGQPEEVAGAVLWLCSDRASFMTGSSLVIDGGLTAQ